MSYKLLTLVPVNDGASHHIVATTELDRYVTLASGLTLPAAKEKLEGLAKEHQLNLAQDRAGRLYAYRAPVPSRLPKRRG